MNKIRPINDRFCWTDTCFQNMFLKDHSECVDKFEWMTHNINPEKEEEFLNYLIKSSGKLGEEMLKYHSTKKEDIVRLYTLESPLYKAVNTILGSNKREEVLLVGSYIKKLTMALFQLSRTSQRFSEGAVYRKAKVHGKHLETLKNISFHRKLIFPGFSSTSKSKSLAQSFSGNLLFTIIVPQTFPNLHVPIDVSLFSHFQEQEVLFPFGSIFKLCKFEGANGNYFATLIYLHNALDTGIDSDSDGESPEEFKLDKTLPKDILLIDKVLGLTPPISSLSLKPTNIKKIPPSPITDFNFKFEDGYYKGETSGQEMHGMGTYSH